MADAIAAEYRAVITDAAAVNDTDERQHARDAVRALGELVESST
jgi:hypothetical protein